jgi:hypothetical protein
MPAYGGDRRDCHGPRNSSILVGGADGRSGGSPPPVSQNPSFFSPVVNYFLDWFPRVTRIQSEQPHWVTPLVTVTPRLEEEYRYDQLLYQGISSSPLVPPKGFGDFDFQSTVGVATPNGGPDRLSMPLAWNTAFQYHLFRYFWPEFETNYTWYPIGEDTGKNQLFLTPGLLIGADSDPRTDWADLRCGLSDRRHASSGVQSRGGVFGTNPLLRARRREAGRFILERATLCALNPRRLGAA